MSDPAFACRSCGRTGAIEVLSLGRTPLANALLSEEQLAQPEAVYPLDLVFCPHCALVQITETVPPEILFREYFYLSSFSETMLKHARELVARLVPERKLGPGSLAAEVASNDGYLLQYYRQAGIPVLGIEPARNIARIAEEKGIPTVCEFFNAELAGRLAREGKQADVLHANNVMAHVADLNGFVEGFRILLKDDGVVVTESPYVKEMIDGCEFDTIYHEHLCYYSVTSLEHLFRRHGLMVLDVERLPIHGGSLRLTVGKVSAGREPSAAVREILREEADWGVGSIEFYQGFASKVERLRGELVSLLADLRARGKRIAAYGASAKGSTLLNYFGIGRETLEFCADRSTVKQGRYTPGTHLPIVPPERLAEAMPDYVLLLTWNFAEEILQQQEAYRRRGGRFIIPIPKVQVA